LIKSDFLVLIQKIPSFEMFLDFWILDGNEF